MIGGKENDKMFHRSSVGLVSVSGVRLQKLRGLIDEIDGPHDHFDGMNECPMCDEPIIDGAIRLLRQLQCLHRTATHQYTEKLLAESFAEDYQRERDQCIEVLRAIYAERGEDARVSALCNSVLDRFS